MSDLNMLEEHQAPAREEASGRDYEPSPDEKKTIKLVEKLFERGKKHRAQYDGKWLDYYNMFRGRQWKDQRPSYRHAEVINLVFRTIQSLVPIQMDARPKFEFLPEEPGDLELAEILNQVADRDWTQNCWADDHLEVVYDANIYGTGISTMVQKPYALGLTKTCYESVDPFYCFPDPNARDVNKRAGWFVHAEPKDVAEIKALYPQHKDHIKADVDDLIRGSRTDSQPYKIKFPQPDTNVLDGGLPAGSANQKDKALLVTAWITPDYLRDEFEEHEKPEVDPTTGEVTPRFEQVARYPNGRKIVVCNGVLLEDGPLGYDDNQIPFQRYINYMLPREFWGMSEVEQLEGPQKTFNKLVSFALDVLTLMGNPIWLIPSSSGVDPENLTNRPGLNVEYDGDRPPVRQEGVQLQPYVLQIIDRMADWFDSLAGSNEVSRGVQPVGVTAAKAITSLQEAAQQRIRQKARLMDSYFQQVGQQWLSRFFQFRTAPEVYRITNKDGANSYFRMHVEHYDKTQPQIDPATGAEIQVPTGETGTRVHYQPMGAQGMDPTMAKVYELRGRFDVRVSTGSALPFAKSEKEQKLLGLFDRGIIDAEEVLKQSEYPNYEAVLQRQQQAAQQAAAAKQTQQMQAG
jgi:hypothetical protein